MLTPGMEAAGIVDIFKQSIIDNIFPDVKTMILSCVAILCILFAYTLIYKFLMTRVNNMEWARMNTLAEKLGHNVGEELDEREYRRLLRNFESGQVARGRRSGRLNKFGKVQ